jgi:hypothetical protein
MMGSRRVRLTLAATAVAAMLAASPAGAQPSPADRETARSMMQEGRDLREKGDLKSALQRFKAADDIMHVPTTGLEVARTQVSLGLLVEALDTIANIRKVAPTPDDPAPFKDARSKADDLDSQVEGKVPALTITVGGAAEGDTPAVSIDGVSVPAGAIGVPHKVDPGHHVITAKGAAGEATEEVDVTDGEKKDVQLLLVKGGEQPAEAATGGPEKKVHTPGGLFWGAVAVGGAGAVAGIVTGVMTLSKTSSLSSECPNHDCVKPQARSDYNSANTTATVSTVGFIVAGAGAAVAIVSLIVGHKTSDSSPASTPPDDNATPGSDPAADHPAQESRLRMTPWIGLGAAGINGSF